jgi:hypothetical protein
MFKPNKTSSLALALLAATMLTPPTATRAEPGDSLGGEFQVNSYTTGSQTYPSVATDAEGNFVVAWASLDQDGDGHGVYAQRYDAAGTPQGAEFRVNTTTAGAQWLPKVAMDADGDFVVVWEDRSGNDGSDFGLFAQRFNAAGAPQGGEFQVNSYTTGSQWNHDAAMDADGDFVVVWQSNFQDGSGGGVFAQRYDASGGAQGGEFQVNTYTSGSQYLPAVAMDADGNFVVAWTSDGQDGSVSGVFAQRYNAAGTAQGSEFQANPTSAGSQADRHLRSTLQRRGRAARTGVSRQHHDRASPIYPSGRDGRGRRLRRDLGGQGRRRRQLFRRLRPAVRCRGRRQGRGISGQQLHGQQSVAAGGRHGRRRRLRRGVDRKWDGRQRGHLRPALPGRRSGSLGLHGGRPGGHPVAACR